MQLRKKKTIDKKVDADRYTAYSHLPKILCINVLTFYYDFQANRRNKLDIKTTVMGSAQEEVKEMRILNRVV